MTGLPSRLGVIAGGGDLPAALLEACDRKSIEPFIVAFDGQTDPALLSGRKGMASRLGAGGAIIRRLKEEGIEDLVFIGHIRRPSLIEMKPDLRTARFFFKLGMRALGDDGLLGAMRKELEAEGFRLHGVQAFMDDTVTPAGVLGRVRPDTQDEASIAHGVMVARTIGALDIGQSVIVQENIVLGVEAIEGTDALIERCAAYRREGRKPVLVKLCKPQQDRDLDLPTIGPRTIDLCIKAGIGGIGIEACSSLIVQKDRVIAMADRAGLFVVGVTPES